MLVIKDMPRYHFPALIAGYLIAVTAYVAITWTTNDYWFNLWLVVFLEVLCLPYILAYIAKAPADTAMLPLRHVKLETAMQPEAVLAKLALAKFGLTKLHDIDADRRVVVFASPAQGMSLGFFYPVFIRGAGAGSIVEVGVQPKSIECKPRVEKALELCAAEVKKLIAA